MTATATAKTATSDTPSPFSGAPPGILVGQTGDWLYGINLDEPRGIKLVSGAARSRLLDLLDHDTTVPNLPRVASLAEESLFQFGLVRVAGRYSAPVEVEKEPQTLNLWLHVANACNLGCYYCYIPQLEKHAALSDRSRSPALMSDQSLDRIVDRIVAYCGAHDISRLHVKFAGGEPTLALEAVERACIRFSELRERCKVSFGILTNGVFDSEKVLPLLRRFRIGVSISVDGMQEAHDALRFQKSPNGRLGTWDTICRNVDLLVQSGIRPYFLFTVTKRNLRDVLPFARFAAARDCGFRLGLERGDHRIPQAQQETFATSILEFYRVFAEEAPLRYRFHRDARFSEWSLDKKKSLACSSCRGYFAVGQTGLVSSCQMRLDEPVGDISVEDFEDVISRFGTNDRTRLLADPSSRQGACSRCEYRFTCAGGCPQHTRNVYSTFEHPSPWCFAFGTILPEYVRANAVHMVRKYQALKQSC